MTSPQTFYAVLDADGAWWAGPFENANKAEYVARKESEEWSGFGAYRVIAYTVIATFGGRDE